MKLLSGLIYKIKLLFLLKILFLATVIKFCYSIESVVVAFKEGIRPLLFEVIV